MVSKNHVLTVSRNGQVSIPTQARARWNVRKVIAADLGDRVVIRPLDEADTAADLRGKYAGRGPSSADARNAAREADALRDRPQTEAVLARAGGTGMQP